LTKFFTLFLIVTTYATVQAQNTRSRDAQINYTIDGVDYNNPTNPTTPNNRVNYDSPDTSVSRYINPASFWHYTTN
jgi:hypothetical protein